MLVTASVDRIELASRLDLSKDLVMRGQVVWTGRSSMDICMQLFQVGVPVITGVFEPGVNILCWYMSIIHLAHAS